MTLVDWILGALLVLLLIGWLADVASCPGKLTDLGDVRMTRGIIGRVLVAGWLGVLTAPLVSAQAPDCKQWNTDEYFKTATVEDVTACLVAGADVKAIG